MMMKYKYTAIPALVFLLLNNILSLSAESLETTYMPYDCSNGETKSVYIIAPYGTGSSGIISMLRSSAKAHADCSLALYLPNDYSGIIISSKNINAYIAYGERVTASDGYVTKILPNNLFGLTEKNVFMSVRPGKPVFISYMTESYHSGNVAIGNLFDLVYTVYTNSSHCSSFLSYFECDNGKCIADELKCDGHNHCGDLSEQKDSVCTAIEPIVITNYDYTYRGTGVTVGYVFGGICLALLILGLVVLLIRKRNRANIPYAKVIHPPPPADRPAGSTLPSTNYPTGGCTVPPPSSVYPTAYSGQSQYGDRSKY